MNNPFYTGGPVSSQMFIGRRRELQRIASRIGGHGQSVALVGEPRSGKTSLLKYLQEPANAEDLYGEMHEDLFFTFVDVHTFSSQFSQQEFWQRTLHDLYEQYLKQGEDEELLQAYQTCKKNQFGTFVLERFFARLEHSGLRLVLLLDEFDVLLTHEILNTAEFFGSLRSLISRFSSLAAVIATRKSLSDLNKSTQEYNRTGSPYFNIYYEQSLGVFSENDCLRLLGKATPNFSGQESQFLIQVSGGHPWLLQIAATELWMLRDEDENNLEQRLQDTGDHVYEQSDQFLRNVWDLWEPSMRLPVALIALGQAKELVNGKKFKQDTILKDLSQYRPELRQLSKLGFVAEAPDLPSGWKIQADVMLWWLADELTRLLRDDESVTQWLQSNRMDGMLSPTQRRHLTAAGQFVSGLLLDGVKDLLKKSVQDALSNVT